MITLAFQNKFPLVTHLPLAGSQGSGKGQVSSCEAKMVEHIILTLKQVADRSWEPSSMDGSSRRLGPEKSCYGPFVL